MQFRRFWRKQLFFDFGVLMSSYDTVVIGGGAAGMTTAIALARMEHRVALVESSSMLAPTLRGFQRQGIFFDTGVHYVGELGEGHVLDTYFRFLGLKDGLEGGELPSDGFLGLRGPDLGDDFFVSYGPDRLRQDLLRMYPHRREEVEHFFRECANYWTSSPYLTFKGGKKNSLESYIQQDISVGHFLGENVDDPGLRAVFSYPAILAGVEPSEATMQVHAQIFASYLRSVHYIKGGGRSLVRAFHNSLKKYGVDIFCSSRATELGLDASRRIRSVRLADGLVLAAENCVYTGSPLRLPELLGDSGLRPAQQKRFSGMQETVSGFVLYARLEGRKPEIFNVPNWLVLRRRGWLRFVGLENENGPSCLHLSMTEEMDGKTGVIIIAPSSFSSFEKWIETLSGNRPADYKDFKNRLADKLLQAVYKEIPEIRGRLQPIATSTPLTFRDYCSNPCGGLYGTKCAVHQYPLLPMTKIEGLFLAGQGVIAPGILGTVISGIVACGMIVGEEKLLEQIGRYKCKES